MLIAEKAKEHFVQAQSKYAKVSNEPKYSHFVGDSPSIIGEVEVSTIVIELIFKTKSFMSGNPKQFLVDFLKNPTDEHLKKILSCPRVQSAKFRDLHYRHTSFLQELYSRTKSRLINATRKMASSATRMGNLEGFAKTFNEFFGEDIMNDAWKKIVDSRKPAGMKIEELQVYILIVAINNFIWTSDRENFMLTHWMEILNHIVRLCDNTLTVNDDCALSYITVYMAILHNDFDRNTLDVERVREFLDRLLGSVDHEKLAMHSEVFELANFYLMLHWPLQKEEIQCDRERFFDCLLLLSKRQSEDHSEQVPWFQVRANRRENQSKLVSLKGKERRLNWGKAYEFYGKLRGSQIFYDLPGLDRQIVFPYDSSSGIRGTYRQVSFNLIFNGLGPRAVNIREAN